MPTNPRDDEFLTGFGSRPGGDALLKPKSALDVPQPEGVKMGSGVVRLGFRHVLIEEHVKVVMKTRPWKSLFGEHTCSPLRSWVVVLLDNKMSIPKHDRHQILRPHPSPMQNIFNPRDASRVLNACNEALADMCSREGKSRNTGLLDALSRLVNMIVAAKPPGLETWPPSTGRPPSTQWNIKGKKIVRPSDIAGCPCAEKSKFCRWLHEACHDLGPFTITPTTAYDNEADIIAAMFHAAKFSLLSMCRTSPINSADLVKGVVLEDSRDVFRVGGSFQEFLQPRKLAPAAEDPNNIAAQTDKHRIVWLIEVKTLNQQLRLARAQPPDSHADLHDVIFKAGTLHVLASAPRTDYARFRMTLAPKSPTCGEHFLVVLSWVGDVLFHHEAMRTKQGLGPVVALMHLHHPATSTAGENFFNGEIGDERVTEFEKQQGLTLSREQRDAVRTINTTAKCIMRLDALAGTGKSLIHALLLAAVVPKLQRGHAIGMVVPARSLRDECVQTMMQIFAKSGSDAAVPASIAARILWLGRPSNTGCKVGTWEDKLFAEVENSLSGERKHL